METLQFEIRAVVMVVTFLTDSNSKPKSMHILDRNLAILSYKTFYQNDQKYIYRDV